MRPANSKDAGSGGYGYMWYARLGAVKDKDGKAIERLEGNKIVSFCAMQQFINPGYLTHRATALFEAGIDPSDYFSNGEFKVYLDLTNPSIIGEW